MEKYAIFRLPNPSSVTVTIPLASPPCAGLLSAKRLACKPHILRYSSATSNSECPLRFAEIASTAAEAHQSRPKFPHPLQRFANSHHYPLPPPRLAVVRHAAPPQYSAPPSASWMHPTHSGPRRQGAFPMSPNEKQVPLKGSAKHRLPSAKVSGEVPSSEFQVTVMLRRQTPLPAANQHAGTKLKDRTYMTREQLANKHGALPADIEKVKAFAAANNLRVIDADAGKRHVLLSGTPQNYNRAFGVDLKMYQAPDCTYRGREGDIHIPESLSGIVTSITGLDNRPFAKPHFRIRRPDSAKAMTASGHNVGKPHAAAAVPAGFSPLQLSKLY